MRHINGMEVRRKRPRGVQEEAQGVQVSPLNLLAVSPCVVPRRAGLHLGVMSDRHFSVQLNPFIPGFLSYYSVPVFSKVTIGYNSY
jgi:hypothetical protein